MFSILGVILLCTVLFRRLISSFFMTFSIRQSYLLVLSVLILLVLTNCAPQNKKTQEKQDLEGTNTSQEVAVEIIKNQQDIELSKSHNKLIVNNPHGNIFVRKTEEQYVGVFTTMQLIGSKPEKAQIKIINNSKFINIDIVYPSNNTSGVNSVINGHKKGRVDLVVFVPKNLRLDLKTTYGSINIKRLENDIDVSTTSGKVKFSSSGKPKITTLSGDVYAYLIRPNWSESSEIISESGNLIITFPDISKLNLKATSKNKILNNFNATTNIHNDFYIVAHEAKQNPITISNTNGIIRLVDMKSQQVDLSLEEKTP